MDPKKIETVHFATVGGVPLPRFAVELAVSSGSAAKLGELKGTSFRGAAYTDIAALQRDLEQAGDDTGYLVFFPVCADYVAAAIRTGTTPSEAIRQWCSLVEDLLSAWRRNRERMALADGHAAASLPRRTCELLAGHFSIEKPLAADSAPEPVVDETDNLAYLVGELAASCATKTAELAAELSAAALRLDEPQERRERTAERLDSVLADELTQRAETERKMADLSGSAKAARKKSSMMQSEIGKLKKTATEATKAAEQLTVRLAERGARAKAVKLSQETRRKQAKAEAAKLRSELKQAKLDLSKTKKKLSGLYASSSWKVTRPIRVIKRALKR